MLAALRQRRQDDEGFTLIELMVVILIIAILLAIAIPTFLGARQRAQNRAAQSNIRNAFTAEKTFYTDSQVYTNSAAAMTAIEPSLSYTQTGRNATAATRTVLLVVNLAGVLTVAEQSAAGNCYWLTDNPASGTKYGQSGAACGNLPAAGTADSWS